MSDLTSLLADRALELLRIPSESGNEEPLGRHVEAFLSRASSAAFVRRRGPAVIAAYGSATPRIVLAGHLDTVPFNGHPEPAIVGDQLVGLGSSDMKGALAVMMTLAERRDPSGASFGLVFYDNEEVDYQKNGLGKVLEAEPWIRDVEVALLLEPTDNVLELGCNGSLQAWVTFHGTAAHSARPWMGENAVHRAAGFLERLDGLKPREYREGPAVFKEVVSVTLAEGGTARNVIPDRFRMNVNMRFPPDRTPEEAGAYLRSLVPEGASVEVSDISPAAPARADAPLLQRLQRAIGIEARAKQGWTDVGRLAEIGIPAANFGPGDPSLAHRRDERVPVANLARSYDILHAFLSSLEETSR